MTARASAVAGVTIGVPAFNEAAFIEATVRSAAHQCECLVVADNASTDGTADICAALQREFPHLRLVRQQRNIGALANFRSVLDHAETPYFMWLGAHDLLPPDYVQVLRAALDADPDAILAYGAASHVDRDGTPTRHHDYAHAAHLAHPEPLHRLRTLLKRHSNLSMIHGLFRVEHLAAQWEHEGYLGVDNVYLARLACLGRFVYRPQTHLVRRDVHAAPDPAAQLERIVGMRGATSLEPMQRGLFALVARESAGTGLAGAWARLEARMLLVSRFGPFGENAAMRALSWPLFAALRLARAVKRAVFGRRRA